MQEGCLGPLCDHSSEELTLQLMSIVSDRIDSLRGASPARTIGRNKPNNEPSPLLPWIKKARGWARPSLGVSPMLAH